MQQITISRDEYHVGFTDVALAANGDLVVIYKQADAHTSHEFTNLVVRISPDQGRTWSKPIVLMETHDADHEGLIRDPRIIRIQDGSLLAIAALLGPRQTRSRGQPYFQRYLEGARTFLFRSADHGRTWRVEETRPMPMVCALRQLRSGVLLVGSTHFSYHRNAHQVSQVQLVYCSTDCGCTWSDPIMVCDHPSHAVGEGDFVELHDGTIVCYMRDEIFRFDLPVRTSGLKCFSRDGGLTWEGPYSAGRWLLNGRIAAGLLASGGVMVLSRLGMGKARPYWGTFFDEPCRLPEFVGYYQDQSPLLHLYIESQADALRRNPPFTSYETPLPPSGRWLAIDNDLNEHPDYGYPGWVNLPSGDVFAVDFIADDVPAALCQIRGYLISQEELSRADRRATFSFRAPHYQPGPLAGQQDWVHHAGPRVSTVIVESQGAVTSRTIGTDERAALITAGMIAPSLDTSKLEAQVVRRDIGPFNLFDEHVIIEFEHRGRAPWCAVQVLDDCREVIAEVRLNQAHPNLQASIPAYGPTVANEV